MGNFNRDDRGSGGFRGGFRGGRSSFGGDRSRFAQGASRDRGFGRGGDRGSRPMFKAICSNCGKECEVPFRPTNGKPVYCSDCFEKMGNKGQDTGRPERSDFRPQVSGFDHNKTALDAINVKLDKILNILEPKIAVPAKPVEKITDKIDLTEVKKAVKKSAKKTAPKKKA